jgi:putative ABC transport system permease protein
MPVVERLRSAAREIGHAVRALGRAPLFTAVAALTLALGIGAAAALFSVVDAIVLKPLGYPDSARIVAIASRMADRDVPQLAGGDEIDIAAERGILDPVAYYFGGEMGVQLGDHAEFVGIRLVHPDFFDVFGVAPLAGRRFTSDDAERSAIVSKGFAERNFGGAAAALTRSLFIESRSYEIVGVMPATMQFPERTDVWAAAPRDPPNRSRTGRSYRVVARLARGQSLAQADARLAILGERLAADFPLSNQGKTFVATPLRDTLAGPVRPTLYVLVGAVALLLLIGCANVASLILARGESRMREIAVRAALGASRRRITGELLVESLVLASIACVLGVLIANAVVRLLLPVAIASVPLPRLQEIAIDWRVVAFAIAVSVLTTIACGLMPALRASRVAVADALNRGGRGTLAGRSAVRDGLVVAQVALSCLLAVHAVLFLRSFVRLTDEPLGFERGGVLVIYAHAPARAPHSDRSGFDEYLRVGRFFDDVLARLRRVPNVIGAAAVMGLPTGQYDANGAFAIEGRHSFDGDPRVLPTAGFRLASPRYFATLGVPLVRGREFTDDDVHGRPNVAVVSQTLARQTFGGEDPIGHRIVCGIEKPAKWMTIVGVVGDVRQASPASAPAPEVYMPLRQHPYLANEVQLIVRGRIAPESLVPPVRDIVRGMNPDVAMKFTTLEASVGNSIAAPRFRATLVSAFAAFALALALAGIYAAVSDVTAQRTAEFGLRMAVGARTPDVVGLVLAGAGRLTIVGVVVGVLLSRATSRIVAALLFGVTTTDLTTYVGVFLLAPPLVVAAALIPALRAARVDPLAALRAE